MLRIGIIGTENSHADHVVRHLNIAKGRSDFRVTALCGGETSRNIDLAAAGHIDTIVEAAEDLIGRVDVAVVANRHGGVHRENAVPLLESGTHVFVDKPTATTVADVEAMIAAANHGQSILGSWSVGRWAAEIRELAMIAAGEDVQTVTVTGPADAHASNGGLFFYGPHIVEPALEILGNPTSIRDIMTQVTHHGVAVTALAEGVRMELNFLHPDQYGSETFWQASVINQHGETIREVRRTPSCHSDSIDRFLDAVLAVSPPMEYRHLVAPVEILVAATTFISNLDGAQEDVR